MYLPIENIYSGNRLSWEKNKAKNQIKLLASLCEPPKNIIMNTWLDLHSQPTV